LNHNMENVICERGIEIISEDQGSIKVSRRHKARTNWMPIILIAMLTVTIILIIPFIKETDVHIQIGYSDNIQSVWVDVTSKPLISYLFPPSYPLGAYTVNVTIVMAGQNVFNVSKVNVPIGEYVLVWQNGVPTHGLYTITVQLYSLQVLKDTYSINVSF